MSIYLVSFVVLGLAFAGLALGVLLGRGPLRGSCGGLNNCSCARPCARQRELLVRLGRDPGGR